MDQGCYFLAGWHLFLASGSLSEDITLDRLVFDLCKTCEHPCAKPVYIFVGIMWLRRFKINTYIYIYIQSWGMDGSLTSVSPVLSSFLIFGERLVLLFGRLFT